MPGTVAATVPLAKAVLGRLVSLVGKRVIELVAALTKISLKRESAGGEQVKLRVAGNELFLRLGLSGRIAFLERQVESATYQRKPGAPDIAAGIDLSGIAPIGACSIVDPAFPNPVRTAQIAPDADGAVVLGGHGYGSVNHDQDEDQGQFDGAYSRFDPHNCS